MPSKLKAGGTFGLILHDDRPDCGRPQFEIKILSVIESDELARLRAQFVAETDLTRRAEIVSAALKMSVSACLIEGYESSPLESLLTPRECWELINAASEGAALTAEERKKFVLPPLSETC